MLESVLIANRGAIAVRIIRTLKKLGVRAIAVYSAADADAPHVSLADEAWSLGEGRAADTYLNQDALLAIIRASGAQAVHPGYGFLSENAAFAERLEQAGIAFIGPTPAQMRAFGLKHEARALAAANDVPLLPGTGLLDSVDEALGEAAAMGYPVMLKSTAGGGGIGMQICRSAEQLRSHWQSIKRLSANNFANSGVFLEKFIERARHIEVQVFGDGAGHVVVLGDRDCSSQRRHQKVIEEAPAPNIPAAVRSRLHAVARTLAQAVCYRNAGTVEFVYDQASDAFYFLEVNTRLQVEHGVTELIYQVDLVAWMVQCAAGTLPALAGMEAALAPQGHAVQARIYAENPARDFQPATGTITALQWPAAATLGATLRIDHWLAAGTEVTPLYDPMLAKIMVHAEHRAQAITGLDAALNGTVIQGVQTNKDYVQAILRQQVFHDARMVTRFLADFAYAAPAVEVLQPGTLTTVQDYPGRTRLWHVGVPPSGPFDSYSFRLGNWLLGNQADAAGLECTLNGPSLLFHQAQTVVLTGAAMQATLAGQPVAMHQPFTAEAGQVLQLGKVEGAGARTYVLFKDGLPVVPYLGSAATFTLGQFGGLSGRALRAGDMLPIPARVANAAAPQASPLPSICRTWQLHVLYGPHGAPDFFTEAGIAEFFVAKWKVHYNSSRTGVRLIGPKPTWARSDGGEAGLHPSNIHDNAYAIGAVDFTGDMPVILGPDGPSLGGFVCPVTVISADLWKLGQLAPGDSVQFVPVSRCAAVAAWRAQNRWFESDASERREVSKLPELAAVVPSSPIIKTLGNDLASRVVYRQQGDQNLLVEYGPLELDIRTRFRVHALLLWLQEQRSQAPWCDALVDLTPGVRSLQVHYDALVVDIDQVLELLLAAEAALTQAQDFRVPARVVHLPLSWDDEQCRLAVKKYMQSVRADAPWCPDNIEFIRRINGLADTQAVKKIVFDASYLVLGLGDVYLGAPLATPLDPRHRLVTTKYNPARTWTAENSVGIGGSYLCIYGMEGPGGYQFVGRTLQMWNRYRTTPEFSQPWLLRFFDQIRFYEVSAEELVEIRKAFPAGRYPLRIEETEFSLADYERFLIEQGQSIRAFTEQRQQAFQQELDDWIQRGLFHFDADAGLHAAAENTELAAGAINVESPVSGSVWQLNVTEGAHVQQGQVLCVLESMKMEIEVTAPVAGTVIKLTRTEGQQVGVGQPLVIVQTDAEHV